MCFIFYFTFLPGNTVPSLADVLVRLLPRNRTNRRYIYIYIHSERERERDRKGFTTRNWLM